MRPIIGLNRYRDGDEESEVKLARTPRSKQQLQVDWLRKFKKKHAEHAKLGVGQTRLGLDRGENIFPAHVGSGGSLWPNHRNAEKVVGRFRPMV